MDNKELFFKVVVVVFTACVLIFGMSECSQHYQRLDQQQQKCIEAEGYWDNGQTACVQ